MVGNANDITHTHIQLHQFSSVNKSQDLINKTIDVKTRYQMTPFKATITTIKDTTATLKLLKAQNQVSPGQSAVLYDKDHVLGGGVIFQKSSANPN